MANEDWKKGFVSLVGAGPGDPGLITVKALAAIKKAEALVYDRLVSPELVAGVPPEAEKIYVGKQPDRHTLPQEAINAILVDKARAGLRVVRLKGGDPFVFGRGGEEALALAAAGIPFEIVPGITSAVAVPAYAGIPVTHRGLASLFTVVTGHEDPWKEKSGIDWPSLAASPGTLVFLMGGGNLDEIVSRLIREGKDPLTPAALVFQGTGGDQRTLAGVLADISQIGKEQGLGHPVVIVIGPVVGLREKLNWIEKRPLFGRRIVVSRARAQAGDFASALAALGAEVLQFPAITIAPPEDYTPLDQALERVGQYQWLIFTSENGVEHFFHRLLARDGDVRDLGQAKLCAIGPRTAEALRARGLRVDMVPTEYNTAALVKALKELVGPGERILLPRADIAPPLLAEALVEKGCLVDGVTAYRTLFGEGDSTRLRGLLMAGRVNMITFTSSSTVRNLLAMLRAAEERQDASEEAADAGSDREAGPGGEKRWSGTRSLLRGVALAAIGPVTAHTLREEGLEVDVEAEESTIEGLTAAITAFYDSKKEEKR